MSKFIDTLQGSLGSSAPGVIGALFYLIIGWILAKAVKTIIQKSLNLMGVNERFNAKSGGNEKSKLNIENGVATGGYFVVLLLTLIAVFDQLGLEVASKPIESLTQDITGYIPHAVGGGVLLLVAWLCSTIVKQIVTGTLGATSLDENISSEGKSLSETIGDISYWLIFLVFLPGVLNAFGIHGLLDPAQSMVDKILNMIPNILAAGAIIFVGWLVAKILRDITTNILSAAGVDNLGEKAGISEKTKLSKVAGLIVYFFTLVPAIISGLQALQIEAIAKPATEMLNSMMAMIPNILGAIAILTITYFVARPVSTLVSNICSAAGLDKVPETLGFENVKAGTSQTVGKIVFFFMMLFASVEAANRLQFEQLSELVALFIQFGGKVLLGSAIIAVGLWVANLAAAAINKTDKDGYTPVSSLIRVVILGLVLAMGLRSMGLANDIVNMAFGITLSAAAVAFALSFGLGGREAAGKQMEIWLEDLRGGLKNRKKSS